MISNILFLICTHAIFCSTVKCNWALLSIPLWFLTALLMGKSREVHMATVFILNSFKWNDIHINWYLIFRCPFYLLNPTNNLVTNTFNFSCKSFKGFIKTSIVYLSKFLLRFGIVNPGPSSLEREVWGSNLGPIKSDTVLPTARHRCNNSSKKVSLSGRNDAEMGSTNSLHALAQ